MKESYFKIIIKFKIYLLVFFALNNCDSYKHDKTTEGLVVENEKSTDNKRKRIIFIDKNQLYSTLIIGSEIQYGDILKIKYSSINPNSEEIFEKLNQPKIFKNKVFITGEDYPYKNKNLKILIKNKSNDTIIYNSIKSNFGYLLDLNTIYFISILKNNKSINKYKLNLQNTKKHDFYSMLIEYSEKKKYVSIYIKENSLTKE